MYLLPSGMPARPNTKWRGVAGLGLLPVMTNFQMRTNGGTGTTSIYTNPINRIYTPPPIPRPPIVPVVEKPTPIVYKPPPIVSQPPRPLPITTLPIRTPIPLPIVPRPPMPAPTPTANAGTPVPASYPVNQFYVATDGSVWEFGSGKWFNTGTPYSAPGASTPPAPAPVASAPVASSGGGSSSAPSAPVNVSVTSDSGYQTILDWLPQSTLLSFAPNWAIVLGGGLLAWKVFGKGGR